MERRSILFCEASILGLSIKGKPLHIQSLSESKSKSRMNSVDPAHRTQIIYTKNEKTPKNFNKTGILLTDQTKSLYSGSSKIVLNKNLGKTSVAESFELDSGTKIYKCMSNPNVNGNSNTFGIPLRASTAFNDTQIEYKPKFTLKKKFNTPKLNRQKPKPKPDTLSQHLLKSNGICLVNEEETSFKYFVGPGNNSSLISRIMKSRVRWRRVYSPSGANFCWTALKKYQILETLPLFEPTEESSSNKAISDFPSILPQELYFHLIPYKQLISSKQRIYNKLAENKELTSKKRLFFNMHSYYTSIGVDPFKKIPLTFHVSYGSYDTTFKVFLAKFTQLQKSGGDNVWIVKPGECTNRGIGINVCRTLEQIIEAINDQDCEYERTYIIQKYINNPFLYKSRKFDIRAYGLLACIQGNIQGFFYKEGYLRTAGLEFNLKNVENKYIHLTNDAVQKYGSNYGKHEAGNKLSYFEFQEYLNASHPELNFFSVILPQLKSLVADTFLATYHKIDPSRKLHSFEVLGYDFMIDSEMKVWLIEVNTNPCLELSSPYLELLIPKMLDQAFGLTIDQLFPFEGNGVNEFEMVFNEAALGLL